MRRQPAQKTRTQERTLDLRRASVGRSGHRCSDHAPPPPGKDSRFLQTGSALPAMGGRPMHGLECRRKKECDVRTARHVLVQDSRRLCGIAVEIKEVRN